MKIMIAPAKEMQEDDSLAFEGLPVYLEKTEEILLWMRGKSRAELQKLWGCNDALTEMNYERILTLDLRKNLTPAILAYHGIQYQYMAPGVFSEEQLSYCQEHLRILSGFYGILKPLDGVTPYRLEMQAKAKIGGAGNLYGFWGSNLFRELESPDRIILNLASKEYSSAVEKYVPDDYQYITVNFCDTVKGRLVQKGVYAKMARGELVRQMAERQITEPEQIKTLKILDYAYAPQYSAEADYVFLKGNSAG